MTDRRTNQNNNKIEFRLERAFLGLFSTAVPNKVVTTRTQGLLKILNSFWSSAVKLSCLKTEFYLPYCCYIIFHDVLIVLIKSKQERINLEHKQIYGHQYCHIFFPSTLSSLPD